jgi:hypothetical protein
MTVQLLITTSATGGRHSRRHQGVHPGDQALPPSPPHRLRNVLPLGHRLPGTPRRTDRTSGHARPGVKSYKTFFLLSVGRVSWSAYPVKFSG